MAKLSEMQGRSKSLTAAPRSQSASKSRDEVKNQQILGESGFVNKKSVRPMGTHMDRLVGSVL